MCGRYTVGDPHRVLAEFSVLEKMPALEPRFNIAPSQGVWVVRVLAPGGARQLDLLHWGMPSGKRAVVMARAESVANRAPSAAGFGSRRCILVADGFYEWRRTSKQSFPYFIHRPGNAPFGMAAIWTPAEGAPLDSCAVITRPARSPVAQLHDRMPAILSPDDYAAWLDPTFVEPSRIKNMLLGEGGAPLVAGPVSPRVNSPANDDPSLTVPIEESDRKGEQMEMWPRSGATR
jgi:putative SOS response-associated peptidase YedK